MTRQLRLDTTPNRSRLQSLATGSIPAQADPSNRTAGKFGAGLLQNVSAITRGEALGHEFWIDAVFLGQVASALSAATDGSKCRFTHPGLSADGLAKGLGLAFGGTVKGDQVLTDLHFYASAHRSPDGDLAGYILDRAAEDPKHFGTSIVFISDTDAEVEFMLANGGVLVQHDDIYGSYETVEGFKSPDPLNVENLPHCRLMEFLAVDVVDDPAANPSGLFHRDLSTITAAESFLDYALGFSEQQPATVSFGVDPERARLFVQRWAAQRGLSLPSKGNAMFKIFQHGKKLASAPTTPPAAAPATPPAAPADDPTKKPMDATDAVPEEDMVTCPECGAVFAVSEDEPQPISDLPQSPTDYAAAHGKYVEAFGAENGSKWFFGKTSFEAAMKLHYQAQLSAKDQEITSLKAKLKVAEDRLSAVANLGTTPLPASPPPAGTEGRAKGANGFASLFKVPGNN